MSRSERHPYCPTPSNLLLDWRDLDSLLCAEKETSIGDSHSHSSKPFAFNPPLHNPVLFWTAVSFIRSAGAIASEMDRVKLRRAHAGILAGWTSNRRSVGAFRLERDLDPRSGRLAPPAAHWLESARRGISSLV